VLAVGGPDVTQQRVVTEYGYERKRARRASAKRDERGGERVKRGCGGGVRARLDSGGEMDRGLVTGRVDDEGEFQEVCRIYSMGVGGGMGGLQEETGKLLLRTDALEG